MSWTTCTRSMLRKSGITLNERFGDRELFAERTYLLAVRRKFRIVALIFQRVHHEFGDVRGLFLLEAASRNRGGTEAVEERLRFLPRKPQTAEDVGEQEVIVGAAGEQTDIVFLEDLLHRFGVLQYLRGIRLK